MADDSMEETGLSSARSFRTILSSTSSSESPSSFSSTTSGEPTIESDDDSREKISVDEGIYGWICSLIEECKVARFVDRASGTYELDWQEVIKKYWFEWRSGRKGIMNDTPFDPRTASNTLRGALLNAYKDKGAKEFAERKVMDRRNKTTKRTFRLPWAVTEKQRRKLDHDSSVVKARTSVRTEASSKPSNSSGDGAVPLPPLRVPHAESPFSVSSLDPRFLAIDEEESESLIEYLAFENSNDEQNFTSFPRAETSVTTNQCTANSSGYESSLALPQNMVQEMDPCEGPYQGGNKSYIFLTKPFHSLAPGVDKKCRVTFGSSMDGFQSPCEVIGTVKNPYTIQVTIPHCPTPCEIADDAIGSDNDLQGGAILNLLYVELSGEQLASSRITVAVTVESWEGVYVGEAKYTYNVNLQERFENYIKVLDDQQMETEFTDASEQTLLLQYHKSDFSGSHVFNYSTFHVLVFVAVKQKADRFLASFLKSSVAFSVCYQLQQQLSTFVDVRKDKIPNKIGGFIRDMFQRLSLENSDKGGTLGPGQCEENREQLKKTDEGYDGGPETNYERELKSCCCLIESLKQGNTVTKGEEKSAKRLYQPADNTVKNAAISGHHGKRREQMEPCNFHLCRINRTAADLGKLQQETKACDADINGGLTTTRIFVVRKPCSPVPVSRSKGGFPDPRTDVFVELQVRKEPKDGDDKASNCEHVTIGRQGVNYLTVNVKHFGTEQSAKDWELKYVKRPCGKIGYWFRFYEPSCELLLVFSLCSKHQAMHPEFKHKKEDSEVLHKISIFLETISWRGPYSKGAKADKESFGLDLLFPRLMPLVHPSRSQTQLCTIMKSLHKFCDNGEWVKFAEKSKSFLQDSHAVDVQTAILLEEAIAFLYQDNLEKAEVTALKALEMVSEAENHQLLAGRAYYYLANVYRREKKLGEAMRCIDLSKQNLQHMEACLDQSFMAYEEGNVMLDFISSGSLLKQKLVLLAKQCYERSLDLRRHLDNTHSTAIPRSHSFALIKMAMLLLDCGTSSGRERTASFKHIEEAKKFLDGLRRHGLDGVTVRRQIQFLLACSDLQYRLSNYDTAFQVAHQALTKAQERGFSLEAVPARERLNHICHLLKGGASHTCVEH